MWCASCTGPNDADCTSCKDPSASQTILGTGLCVCPLDEYLSSTTGLCNPCPSDCVTCYNFSGDCKTCGANAEVSSGRCECVQGSFKLPFSTLCTNCFEDCMACTSYPDCTLCLDSQATLESGVCNCPSGTYMSASICHDCPLNCEECSGSSSCDKCESVNSEFDGTSCVCKAKHIQVSLSPQVCTLCPDSTFVEANTCKPCRADCATCLTASKCETCLDSNAIGPEECPCKPGFFKDGFVCTACSAGCEECLSASVCVKCSDSKAEAVSGVCTCKNGFIKVSDSPLKCEGCLPGTFLYNETCETCTEGCATCVEKGKCVTCKDPTAVLSASGLCVCPLAYYKSALDLLCYSCSENCLECIDSSNCLTCFDSLAEVRNGECKCKEGTLTETLIPLKCISCGEGSYLGSTGCLACAAECLTCSKESECLSCRSTGVKLSKSGKCLSGLCELGQYFEGEECKACEEGCKVCRSETECIECEAPGYVSEGKCKCEQKFLMVRGKCKGPVEVIVEYLDDKTVRFTLYPEDSYDLTPEELGILIDAQGLPYRLKALGNSQYEISLEGDGSFLNTETVLTIAGAEVDLSSDKDSSDSNNSWDIPWSTLTTAILLTGLVAGTFTGSWSATWSFFNTLQLIYYIPMKQIPLPQILADFFVSILNIHFIPGLLNIPLEDGNPPEERVKRLRFQTTTFLVNSTTFLAFLSVALIAWPIIKLLSEVEWKPLQSATAKLLQKYKFNFFLRLYIEAYMELTFFAFLQLTSISTAKPSQIVSTCLSVFFLVRAN
mmetsp:Transcript_9539/g.18553  ORF Transcript_9539/g.18553 Transcript_9539/m.18553 type:complete len:780 (+) Transcript_9539:233-2572(+)